MTAWVKDKPFGCGGCGLGTYQAQSGQALELGPCPPESPGPFHRQRSRGSVLPYSVSLVSLHTSLSPKLGSLHACLFQKNGAGSRDSSHSRCLLSLQNGSPLNVKSTWNLRIRPWRYKQSYLSIIQTYNLLAL